jgi:DNA adenine methylase
MQHRRYVSPLRYPGGKATMAPWLADRFAAQRSSMDVEVWIEPFAGGAGAALTLLDRDAVGEAWLVDANPGIAAFWAAVVGEGEALAARVERTRPTLDLFETARALLGCPSGTDPFELGYAAFVVNRCSRSGIIAPRSGVMSDIGARFNAPELAERIRHVASFGSRLRVHHGDGISFIEDAGDSGIADEVLFFCDPPYVREGPRLYSKGLDAAGHQRLADALNSTPARWVLTYDDEPVVAEVLYPERRVLAYDIRNSANRARVAREFAVFSDNLDLGDDTALLPYGETTWLRAA